MMDWEPICTDLPLQLWDFQTYPAMEVHGIHSNATDKAAPLLLDEIFGWHLSSWPVLGTDAP